VRFTEINLFGVYVAPMSLMMVAAWVVTIGLRQSVPQRQLAAHVSVRPLNSGCAKMSAA
jgi:hypothetical protein